jgi:oligopeptide/dipeptide ABC transporter ATP-binding protein
VTVPGNPPNLAALPSGCPFHPRCPYRFEPCDRQPPPLTPLGDERYKRCHLPTAPPPLAS